MNIRTTILGLLGVAAAGTLHAATPANQFLQYVHGAEGVEIEKLCVPTDDFWMLRGAKNPAALAQLAEEKISHGANEVLWANIQNGLCLVEIRDGKIDAGFMLEQIYTLHRQLVLQFIYAALGQDREALGHLTTKPANVRFGGAKAPPGGDMDVYQGVVAQMPVVRTSPPAADKASKSVSYRVPLGKHGLALRLVKKGSTWLIDTDTRLDVPLEFFFQ